eukprot:TRINITY_DN31271_c0_g2_i1.p1 TRINITY_DN31271_c0_g2~~TRINITY_DN31271_c0_g2_i1.p1  ORF type:complete len:155 (-),score=21.67 TRINITY_DN31271_c0_g2_i1:102-518(-)
MRETLFIMNTRRSTYRWSWLVLYTIQMILTAVCMTICSKYGNLAGNSDITVTFTVYFVFLMSSMTFMYCISVFFARTKTASLVSMIVFLAGYFPAAQFNTTDYETGKTFVYFYYSFFYNTPEQFPHKFKRVYDTTMIT